MVKLLINTPNMLLFENPEEGERIRQDNIDFQEEQKNASPKRTAEIQAGVSNTLGYAPFNTQKKGLEIKEKTPESDSPYFPRLQRLFDTGKITKEEFMTIAGDLDKNDGGISSKNIDKFIKSIPEKTEKQRLSDFGKDIKGLNEFSSLRDAFEKKDNDSINFDLYNLIGKEYIKMQQTDGTFDIKEDLSTSININLNSIISTHKNLPKDSQTYINAVKNVKTGNLEDQIDGLKTIFLLSSSIDGFSAAKTEKQKKLVSGKIEPELEKRKVFLETKINSLEQDLIKETGVTRKKIEDDINDLKKELEEVSKGEIFSGTEKIDKSPDKIKTNETPA